jgi:coatomer protein complex subunit epsilon
MTGTNGSNAVLVQLLLSIDRKDLAQTTYQNVKKFGNDSILVQAMEAWIGLKTVSIPVIYCFNRLESLEGRS